MVRDDEVFHAGRPSRLAVLTQVIVTLLLSLSFFSGVLLWWGQTLPGEGNDPLDLGPPQPVWWLHGCRILHGSLNPFLCGLFGYLLCRHIRYGWERRANWATGLVMELLFLGLILTGAGIYYVGAEDWRSWIIWGHRLMGVTIPVGLGLHWYGAVRWRKKI